MNLFSMLLFGACHHRAPPTPAPADPAPAAEAPVYSVSAVETPDAATPAAPPTHIVEAFLPLEGTCHFAHIDAATGNVVASWSVDSKMCPDRATRTTTSDGTHTFALRMGDETPLWQISPGVDVVEVLPKIEYLEFASYGLEGHIVHAVTSPLPGVAGPNVVEVVEEEEEFDEDMYEDQWTVTCYSYSLEQGEDWRLTSEVEVETWEGMRGPACTDLVEKWDTTSADYSGLIVDNNDIESPVESLPAVGWSIVYDLDVTRSGESCAQDCGDDELLRRYALSTDWFEGWYLTGYAMSAKDDDWQRLEGLDERLREFFLVGDQLILCSEKGFGAWNHATATRSWWKESQTCPFQPVQQQ